MPTGQFTPWQIIVSTLTALYAVRNFDKILGLGCKAANFLNLTSLTALSHNHSTRATCSPGEIHSPVIDIANLIRLLSIHLHITVPHGSALDLMRDSQQQCPFDPNGSETCVRSCFLDTTSFTLTKRTRRCQPCVSSRNYACGTHTGIIASEIQSDAYSRNAPHNLGEDY